MKTIFNFFSLIICISVLGGCLGGSSPSNLKRLEQKSKNPLEIQEIKAGFYGYGCNPIVIVKIKNVSDMAFNEETKLRVVFYKDDEEIDQDLTYFHAPYSHEALEPGISRQAYIQSRISYSYPRKGVKCKVYLNDKLVKDLFEIPQEELISNRIQNR